MRPILIGLLALTLAGPAGAALAQTTASSGPAASAGLTPDTAPSGQPPFGGTLESRLQRLGADADHGVKRGWWSEDQGRAFAKQIRAIGDEAVAARDHNRGKLAGADRRRLQQRITQLHQQMTDLASQKRKGG